MKDLFYDENLKNTHPELYQFLDEFELYYGFTRDEIVRFKKGLEEIGYTCDIESKNKKKSIEGPSSWLYIGFYPVNLTRFR